MENDDDEKLTAVRIPAAVVRYSALYDGCETFASEVNGGAVVVILFGACETDQEASNIMARQLAAMDRLVAGLREALAKSKTPPEPKEAPN